MAQPLATRTITAKSETLTVISMYDKRSPVWDSVEFLLQADLEALLYWCHSTGAFYRLLQRSQESFRPTLSLRRISIDKGLISDLEWKQLVDLTHPGVRVLTLVPFDAAAAALRTYGRSTVSIALLRAIGATVPRAWLRREEGEGEEEEVGAEEEGR